MERININNKLKSLGKRIVTSVIKAKDGKVQKLIKKADVVSFDIFDTLVKRCVKAPEDVHKIVSDKFYRETGILFEEYQKYRIEAEKRARKRSGEEEISLEEIFSNLEQIPNIYKSRLQELEEDTEIEICCPCLRIKRFYHQARQEKKHIIITSDMYLSQNVIKSILQKCGYKNYEKLYLSSAYRLCKSTGNIYKIVKRDYSEFSGKILHIGDNIKGDFLAAKRNGLNACLTDGRQINLKYWKLNNGRHASRTVLMLNKKTDFDFEKLFFYLNHHISSTYNDAETIGYEILGPMLLGYCMWLKEKIEENGIEKIFFLSREGKILQEAFHVLYPEYHMEQCYLYVSRQSLVVPLIADAENFDDMIEIIKIFLHNPILKTVRTVCSLKQEDFCGALSEIGINEDMKIYEIPSSKKEAVFSIVQKLGRGKFEQQKKFVKRYLKENGFTGNIAVADIGWSGSIQNALVKYTAEDNTNIHGYYLGVRNVAEQDEYQNLHREGYLFDINKNETFDLMARFTLEIFEMLLLNQQGSVKKYDIRQEKVIPVLKDAEYKGREGSFIEAVQKTAVELLETIGRDTVFRDSITVCPDYVMAAYANFAVYPKMNTIHIFENFSFLDIGVKQLIPEHGLIYYLFHPDELKKDFENSFCKIFFMKKLFKIELPYFKILSFLAVKMNIQSNYRKMFYKKK